MKLQTCSDCAYLIRDINDPLAMVIQETRSHLIKYTQQKSLCTEAEKCFCF